MHTCCSVSVHVCYVASRQAESFMLPSAVQEALFWAFYYQPGSFQQHLAARELKRQFWRYHKHHGAWFQVRHLASASKGAVGPALLMLHSLQHMGC